jgi:ethanolamine utilization protein EutQ
MKTLISAETVRQAHAKGQLTLAAGKQVIVTPEASELAGKLGVHLDPNAETATPASPAAGDDAATAIRNAVIAQLPAELAGNSEFVDQVVGKVCALQKGKQAAASASRPMPARTDSRTTTAAAGVKLVKGNDVHLGVFPGAGAEKQVGIADVITAADGAPIAAGFMAWSQAFFPWTLDYDEIDLVLEGELHIRCNGQTQVGKSGDVFYIPKGSAIEFGTPGMVRFFYVTYPANWQG